MIPPQTNSFDDRAGFTMVEVLVVVAIIGILFSISLPTLRRMKSNARSSLCMTHLREIGVGLNTYFIDKGMIFPELVAAKENRNDEEPSIDTELYEYVGENELVFQCPADYEGLFEKTGSSYFWNSLLNGQKVSNLQFLGLKGNGVNIPVASDKENFHKHIGDGVNILYADGHVLQEVQFMVTTQ